MSVSSPYSRRIVSALVSITLITTVIIAQTPQQPAEDIVRISTELVQTGVVVLDKQGKFVAGLKPEQFALKVDGRPVTPSFFEQVAAGSEREQKLERAASLAAAGPVTTNPGDVAYRGRTIVFFIDDLHLGPESVLRTRQAMLEFIDNKMGAEDQVAIASASGQLGFLQQFTDVKPMLRAAVSRLTHKPYTIRDAENISMTEYQALKIDQGDKDATDYYVEELLKASNFRIGRAGGLGPPSGGRANTRPQNQGLMGGMTRESAARLVKERAVLFLRQASGVTTNTLATLESLMRSSGKMSGRKLVFFVSDGFYLNDRNTAFSDKLKRITDAALRAGVVVYSLDARGLMNSTDASSNRADGMGQLSRSNIGEVAASQDALSALAADTGGKAYFNAGALTAAITDALRETSNYYLLAWRPTSEEQRGINFKRIEVTVVGRPELSVRLPRGFMLGPVAALNKDEAKAGVVDTPGQPVDPVKGLERTLVAALSAPSARTSLPLKLDVSFIDVPGTGPVLTAATLMSTEVLGYGADGKQPAAIDLAGIVLNDQGKQAGSFKTRVNVKPVQNSAVHDQGVIYTHKLPMKPGIYQVRVAARDDKSGLVGSDAKWFEVPDLSSKRLMMSSLLVGGQFVGSGSTTAGGEQMQFSVDRRFAKGAHLNFLTFIYNAATSPAPDLEAQIKIIRNGQAVVTSPARKVPIEAGSDLTRIVYGANVALQTLPAGRYLLQVAITDRNSKAVTSQQTIFEIE